MRLRFAWLSLLVLCCQVSNLWAGNPARMPVQFSVTQDVGSGNEVFVSGNHRDLSSGGIQQFGVKLHWTPGNVWTGFIAVEAGAQITYSFSSRPINNTNFCGGGGSTVASKPTMRMP